MGDRRYSDNVGRGQRVTACFCHRPSVGQFGTGKAGVTYMCMRIVDHSYMLQTVVIAQEDLIAYTSRENFGLRTPPLLVVRLGNQSHRITQQCGLLVEHNHNHM